MPSAKSDESANIMFELYFQTLRNLELLEPLDEVPFLIQQRKTGFTPRQRCLSILASLALDCEHLTDWTLTKRLDSRLQHWLDDRPAPHCSTLSRSLAATDKQTVQALREKLLVPLTNQCFLYPQALGPHVFFDIDNKALPAEGEDYEGTATGRTADNGFACGYRLHLISLANCWPLEMYLTGANAHAVPSAMVMFQRLMGRIHGSLRDRLVVRGDADHGCVRFIRFLGRYRAGYLLKAYNSDTARNLWNEHSNQPQVRVVREDKIDLLAIDLGATVIHGMTRKELPKGKQRRKPCQVTVPRVVVYHEDPTQVPEGTKAQCFALFTTLPTTDFDPAGLLEKAYLPRAGDIENIFSQLDQAFRITNLRSRRFYGNWTFLLLALVAAILTQMIRDEANVYDRPIPAGLKETLVAAADSGLRLTQDPDAGCVMNVTIIGRYTETFQLAIRCSHQHRFRFAA